MLEDMQLMSGGARTREPDAAMLEPVRYAVPLGLLDDIASFLKDWLP